MTEHGLESPITSELPALHLERSGLAKLTNICGLKHAHFLSFASKEAPVDVEGMVYLGPGTPSFLIVGALLK